MGGRAPAFGLDLDLIAPGRYFRYESFEVV